MTDRAEYQREYSRTHADRKRANARAWYAENKDRKQAYDRDRRSGPLREDIAEAKRDDFLMRRYGITREERDAIVARQDGRCAICRVEIDRRAHVDHDHTTGRVRGVLCHNCNVGLGHFRDNAELLRRAVEYLD